MCESKTAMFDFCLTNQFFRSYTTSGQLEQKWTCRNSWCKTFTGQLHFLVPNRQHRSTVSKLRSGQIFKEGHGIQQQALIDASTSPQVDGNWTSRQWEMFMAADCCRRLQGRSSRTAEVQWPSTVQGWYSVHSPCSAQSISARVLLPWTAR